ALVTQQLQRSVLFVHPPLELFPMVYLSKAGYGDVLWSLRFHFINNLRKAQPASRGHKFIFAPVEVNVWVDIWLIEQNQDFDCTVHIELIARLQFLPQLIERRVLILKLHSAQLERRRACDNNRK